MGNEGSSFAEPEAKAPPMMPRLKAHDRRLLRLSALEQLLLVGPPPGAAFEFDLDACIDEASAAQREHAFVRRAMDRLCQPGMLPEELFWRNYFYLRRSGALPTLAERLCEARRLAPSGAGASQGDPNEAGEQESGVSARRCGRAVVSCWRAGV